MVHQYGDIELCAPTLHKAVPMFAAINFLQLKSNTDEGQALKQLDDACRDIIRYLLKPKHKEIMALAILYDVENILNADQTTISNSFNYHAKLFTAFQMHNSELKVASKRSEKYKRCDYPLMQITMFDSHKKHTLTGCGYAMVCASKV